MKRFTQAGPICALAILLVGCDSRTDDGQATVTPTSSNGEPAPAVPADELSCTFPVTGGEDADAVLRRFGKESRAEELPGAEGTTMPGLVLWGNDPARRVEVLLSEGAPAKVVGWRIGEGATRSVQGALIGDSVAKLATVNGSPFRFYGFSWDYGGYVTDWKGGTFDDAPGGCEISMRLAPSTEDLPTAIMGESEISSDNPLVAEAGAVVSEISVGFQSRN